MEKTFNLLRWFSLLSLICIGLISASSAFLLSRFLTDTILSRDAVVSMNFIESIVEAENTWSYFVLQNPGQTDPRLVSFFNHIAHMPDVVRANVYAADRTMLWSSDAALIGKRFFDNDELETALQGHLTVESGIVGETEKAEHVDLPGEKDDLRFVETYVPIWDRDHHMVVGAVELYRLPRALQRAILEGTRLVWASAIVGGLLLFTTLFWIVWHANSIMRTQQQQLLESETLAMIGETAAAIAHGIRNPLASIRASAELTLVDDLEGARESANDIMSEVDRLDRWARELLQFSRMEGTPVETIAINEVIRSSLSAFETSLERQGIRLTLSLQAPLPAVRGNTASLGQVVGSLIANAIEAMLNGGELRVISKLDAAGRAVEVTISDTGPGLSKEMMVKVFRPFFSTKPSGTGLGLALSRRIAERCGGALDLTSSEGRGVTATLRLPAAS